jgi:stage II sporulation protein D
MSAFVSASVIASRRLAQRSVAAAIGLLLASPLVQNAWSQAPAMRDTQAETDVRIGVLGLFHPAQLEIEQTGTQTVAVTASGSASGTWVLNGEPGHRRLLLRADREKVVLGNTSSAAWQAASRDGSPVGFQLAVPGKLRRTYVGRLTVEARHGELVAIVSMSLETAVLSIVSAEMPAGAPLEALKAQAIVARSFLAAGSRHREFDFCDTTHCQYLRTPQGAGVSAAAAVNATSNMILAYQSKPLGAMYSSRCGGSTHSLREVGMDPHDGYPYYAVDCPWCRRHPVRWQSRVAAAADAPASSNEPARLAKARVWGWSVLPGSDFTTQKDAGGFLLQGHSIGHGIGLCQMGAIGMAATGVHCRQILEHYYPHAELEQLR